MQIDRIVRERSMVRGWRLVLNGPADPAPTGEIDREAVLDGMVAAARAIADGRRPHPAMPDDAEGFLVGRDARVFWIAQGWPVLAVLWRAEDGYAAEMTDEVRGLFRAAGDAVVGGDSARLRRA